MTQFSGFVWTTLHNRIIPLPKVNSELRYPVRRRRVAQFSGFVWTTLHNRIIPLPKVRLEFRYGRAEALPSEGNRNFAHGATKLTACRTGCGTRPKHESSPQQKTMSFIG
jgi:hypothetical protein